VNLAQKIKNARQRGSIQYGPDQVLLSAERSVTKREENSQRMLSTT